MSDCVKHGKEEEDVYVEVDLFLGGVGKKDGIATIRRTLHANSNGTSFHLNGKTTKVGDVRDFLKGLSIDMENLCTFMPQDKVGNFSRFKPREVLQKTLEAIRVPDSDKSYHEVQRVLNDVEESKLSAKANLDLKVNERASVQHSIDQMATEITRMQQREEIKTKYEHYEVKLTVLKCQDAIQAHEDAQKAVTAANSRLTEANNSIEPLQVKERDCKRKLAQTEAQTADVEKRSEKVESRCRGLNAAVAQSEADLEAIQDHLKFIEKQRMVDQQIHDKTESLLAKYEGEYELASARLPDVEALLAQNGREGTQCNGRIQELNGVISEKNMEFNEETDASRQQTHELANLRDDRELFKMKLKRSQHGKMGRNHNDVLRAMDFVEKNRNKFKDEVYGPMAMFMNVQDPAAISVLETIVPNNKLCSFVAANYQDSELLKREFMTMKLRVDVMTVGNMRENRSNGLPMSSERAQSIGLQGYIGDQIVCPDIIRSVLNTWFYVDKILWSRLDESHPMDIITREVLAELNRGASA